MGGAVVPMCFWEDDGVRERKTTFPTVYAPGVNFSPATALCRAKALVIPITLGRHFGQSPYWPLRTQITETPSPF